MDPQTSIAFNCETSLLMRTRGRMRRHCNCGAASVLSVSSLEAINGINLAKPSKIILLISNNYLLRHADPALESRIMSAELRHHSASRPSQLLAFFA